MRPDEITVRLETFLRLFLHVAEQLEEERTTLTSHYWACRPGRTGSPFSFTGCWWWCRSPHASLSSSRSSAEAWRVEKQAATALYMPVLLFPTELDRENDHMVQVCDTRCVKMLAEDTWVTVYCLASRWPPKVIANMLKTIMPVYTDFNFFLFDTLILTVNLMPFGWLVFLDTIPQLSYGLTTHP